MKRIKINKDKKGAIAVLLVLIFVSISFAGIMLLEEAGDTLKASVYDGAFNVACRSILSEYDRGLMEDYGIAAYCGAGVDLEEKLKRYIEANTDLNYRPIAAKSIDIHLLNEEYSLQNTELFLSVIKEAVKYKAIEHINEGSKKQTALPEKCVNNQMVIKGLPSQNIYVGNGSELAVNIERFLSDKYSEHAIVSEYIRLTFNSRFINNTKGSSFYNYEKEYILSGRFSERQSLEYVKAQIYLLRYPLNVTHIMTDSRKMAEIEKYIAMLPVTAEPVEAAVIIALWAAGETENDVNLLLAGKNVALYKNAKQWSLSLNQALISLFLSRTIEPSDKGGLDYEAYLGALLYAKPMNIKLVRIMDLIQINLKNSYRGDFLLREHYTGFDISAEIDGRNYSYSHVY